jgi:hypothetical protein
MFRLPGHGRKAANRFPHTRGDVSHLAGGLAVELSPRIVIYEVVDLLDCALRVLRESAVSEETTMKCVILLVSRALVAGVGIGIEGALPCRARIRSMVLTLLDSMPLSWLIVFMFAPESTILLRAPCRHCSVLRDIFTVHWKLETRSMSE